MNSHNRKPLAITGHFARSMGVDIVANNEKARKKELVEQLERIFRQSNPDMDNFEIQETTTVIEGYNLSLPGLKALVEAAHGIVATRGYLYPNEFRSSLIPAGCLNWQHQSDAERGDPKARGDAGAENRSALFMLHNIFRVNPPKEYLA